MAQKKGSAPNKNQNQKLAYTTILHKVRKEFDISLEDYCIADCIYHLSGNPKSEIKGWCYASKRYIASFIELGERTVFRSIEKLIKKGIVFKDSETKYIRTTTAWYEKAVMPKMKEEYDKLSEGMPNRHSTSAPQADKDYDKVADNIYSSNNKTNNKDIVATATPEKKEFSFKSKMQEMQLNVRRHIQIIALYWDYKGFEYENERQYKSALDRDLKPASKLVGYDNDRISDLMGWLNDPDNCDFNWKLETINKLIDVPNLKSFKKKKNYNECQSIN